MGLPECGLVRPSPPYPSRIGFPDLILPLCGITYLSTGQGTEIQNVVKLACAMELDPHSLPTPKTTVFSVRLMDQVK